MLKFAKFGLLGAAVTLTACSADPGPLQRDAAPLPPPAQSVGVNGTVRFVPIEGGCWALETEVGFYEPVGLPKSLRNDGQRVQAWISQPGDLASICQIGTLVVVDSVIPLL